MWEVISEVLVEVFHLLILPKKSLHTVIKWVIFKLLNLPRSFLQTKQATILVKSLGTLCTLPASGLSVLFLLSHPQHNVDVYSSKVGPLFQHCFRKEEGTLKQWGKISSIWSSQTFIYLFIFLFIYLLQFDGIQTNKQTKQKENRQAMRIICKRV